VLNELDDPTSTPLGFAEIGSVTALVFTVVFGGILFAAVLVVARLGRVPTEKR